MNIVDVTVVLHVNFLIKLNISNIYTKAKYSAVSCVLMILKSVSLILTYFSFTLLSFLAVSFSV